MSVAPRSRDMTSEDRDITPAQQLLHTLFKELFQTERSAAEHPVVEADRIGHETPPGRAMMAVVPSAKKALDELPGLAEGVGFPPSAGAIATGKGLSEFRDHLADLVVSSEQSYRVTLLGIRHGVDVVRAVRHAAMAGKHKELVSWCTLWLAAREPLVLAVERELAWWSAHPEEANKPAKNTMAAKIARTAVSAVGKVEDAVSRSKA